jgi:predicted Zn-dependent peptidase
MRETADRLLILSSELDKERGVILSEKRPARHARLSRLHLESRVPVARHAGRATFPIGEEEVISPRRASAWSISIAPGIGPSA